MSKIKIGKTVVFIPKNASWQVTENNYDDKEYLIINRYENLDKDDEDIFYILKNIENNIEIVVQEEVIIYLLTHKEIKKFIYCNDIYLQF